MSKSNRREQASKRVRNEAMGEAFRELRKGSRAQPHRMKKTYHRPSANRSWSSEF